MRGCLAQPRWRSGIAGMVVCGGVAAQIAPPHAPASTTTGIAETVGTHSRRDIPAEASTLLECGRAALRAGDRYAALAAIAQASRLQPGNPEISQALADVLMELGAPSAAAHVPGLA